MIGAMLAILHLLAALVSSLSDPYKPVELNIHAACHQAPRVYGAVVAGVGFEPTTFRL